MKRIYLVRHGETNANLNKTVTGKSEPLNETGLVQAEKFAVRMESFDFEKLFVSDFLRAQQTAAPIITTKQMKPNIEAAFGEALEPSSLFGISEDSEIVMEHKRNRNSNIENPLWRQEDGENFEDIFKRVTTAKRILEEDTAENILVVSHSFFLQLFTAAILLNNSAPTNNWLQIARTLKISNVGITLLTFDKDVWRLVMWNDHSHFAE